MAGSPIILRGITWNHTRGFLPKVATAQRFSELHPNIEVKWEKRSLQAFADESIEQLAEKFDLLVIDHPFVGQGAKSGLLVPLDEHLPAEFLAEQSRHSVGHSHRSYFYDDHQWALAVDAAAPVASWRADLLSRHGLAVPQSWEEVQEIARKGLLGVPGIPVDSLMNLFMFCLAHGEEPLVRPDRFVSDQVGEAALHSQRDLMQLVRPSCLQRNPIQTYEAMVATDDISYCPFAFGYSNYSRPGYGRRDLTFGPLVTFGKNGPLCTTLGGTGLAISTRCISRTEALAYAQFVADPFIQETLYCESGGQPGHRAAWVSPEANRRTRNYFRDTLPPVDAAWLRPRYPGYMHFQDHAGPVVFEFQTGGLDAKAALRRLNQIYTESQAGWKPARV